MVSSSLEFSKNYSTTCTFSSHSYRGQIPAGFEIQTREQVVKATESHGARARCLNGLDSIEVITLSTPAQTRKTQVSHEDQGAYSITDGLP